MLKIRLVLALLITLSKSDLIFLERTLQGLDIKILLPQIDRYFAERDKKELDKKDFTDLFLKIYVNQNLEYMEKISSIVKKIGNFHEVHDHNIYLKNKIEEYLNTLWEDTYDIEFVRDIVRNSKFLYFIDEKIQVDKRKYYEQTEDDFDENNEF